MSVASAVVGQVKVRKRRTAVVFEELQIARAAPAGDAVVVNVLSVTSTSNTERPVVALPNTAMASKAKPVKLLSSTADC